MSSVLLKSKPIRSNAAIGTNSLRLDQFHKNDSNTKIIQNHLSLEYYSDSPHNVDKK